MIPRPERPRVRTELGREQTPPAGPEQFERLGAGQAALFLGLGPDPAAARDLAGAGRTVYCMEHPDFKSQMPPSWAEAVPRTWSWLAPGDLPDTLPALCEVFLYRPGMRLFPSFWGPLFARCRAHFLRPAPPAPRSALLPGDERGLLVRELAAALAGAGWAVRTLPPDQTAARLPDLLRRTPPELFLSINFAGLDPCGETFHLLRAAGTTVAAWLVDNPFHVLSGLRAPYWKDMPLAATDASFLPALHGHGAGKLLHLPLAAWPGHFGPAAARPAPAAEGLDDRLVFVGRSAFPDRDKFFAGCAPPPELEEQARAMLRAGQRPGFHWWARELGIPSFWPGNEVRRAGCGADRAGLAWRAACLEAAAGMPFTAFGDEGWRGLLPPGADLRGPLDYYGPLAAVYARAGAVLNVNGLLLPAGLTQRHFDVWAAGGFLLTDAFPGLDIFPGELVREISFRTPAELPALARRALSNAAWRQDVAAAWRGLVEREHTYARRTAALLGWLDLA
ncbi:MAG: glycosyltransferase [Thermodesulfobacteriota bacterium]